MKPQYFNAIIKEMGNTVGNSSANFCNFYSSKAQAYVLGLWCADGYHRTSSIGLSNINPQLIQKFLEFLKKTFSDERLRLKVYISDSTPKNYLDFGVQSISVLYSKKAKNIAYHLYVNSRGLLREFVKAKQSQIKQFANTEIAWAYIAGRFDGDGTIGKDLKRDLRISYTRKEEAEQDKSILESLGLYKCKVYYYRTSSAYVLYVSRNESKKFVEGCLQHSVRLQKLVLESRRDLISVRARN